MLYQLSYSRVRRRIAWRGLLVADLDLVEECVESVVPTFFQGVRGGVISSNTIDGFALGGPREAFRLLDDPGTAVSQNPINGTLYQGL